MVRKVSAVIVVIILVILAFLFVSKYYQKSEYSNQMVTGMIKEVKNDSIIVEGLVRLSGFNPLDEKRVIEFIITPQTILKKSTISATMEQMKSGKPFLPITTITTGIISDLIEGVGMFKIESRDNLFSVTKTTATEIDYIIHDFPLPPTN